MEENNITVKELITNVNKELKEIFDKPVIKKGYDNYDEKQGRAVITLWGLKDILKKYTKISFSEDKFDLYIYNTALRFKTKRKKSDIISSWGATNQMTIVSIYLEDESLLNKTINQIWTEGKEKVNREKIERNKEANNQANDFLNKLTECGIDFKTFKALYQKYKYLDYDTMNILDKQA